MSDIVTAVTQAAAMVVRFIGTDVLVSLTGLALVVLFFYLEGGPHSRPSH